MFRAAGACVLLFAVGAKAAPVPVVPPEPLPNGATARLGTHAFRGPHTIGLTFSTDGKRIIAFDGAHPVRDKNPTLVIWDADTGKLLTNRALTPPDPKPFPQVRAVQAADQVVWLVEPPPRGRMPSEVIVTDLDRKVVSRFEVDGKPIFQIEQFRNGFGGSAVSPDGRHLASVLSEGRMIVVYELATGKRVLAEKIGPKDRPSVSLSPDNRTLFVREADKPVRRYDLPSGIELPALEGTNGEVWQAAASPDGKWVVTGKFRTRKTVGDKVFEEDVHHLEVHDSRTGKFAGRLDVGGMTQHFTFTGAEALIVSAHKNRSPALSLRTASRWNVATLKREWEASGAGRIAVSPDGKRFASDGAPVALRDVATGKLLVEPRDHTGAVEWVAFSADGKTVTTAGEEEIITWAVTGERKQRTAVPELRGARLTFSGVDRENRLAWRNHTNDEPPAPVLYGWDREKNAVGWRIGAEHAFGDQVATRDGQVVVHVRAENTRSGDVVTVSDGTTGKKLREWSHPRPAGNVVVGSSRSVSGDGRFVVVGGDSPVLILDAETGTEHARVTAASAKRAPTGLLPALAVSANGSKLAIFGQKKVEVLDTKTGTLLAEHAFKENQPRVMKFSPDGRWLVLWHVPHSRPTSTVFVWDVGVPAATPRVLAESWSQARCTAFSPDGKALAVGYADGTTLLWDLTAK